MWRSYMDWTMGERMVFWAANGNIFGAIYGTRARKFREENKTSDHMELTFYDNVQKDKIKPFESSWNEFSRLCQRQTGYEWTKMYKSIAFENSPFQYLSVRMWTRKQHSDQFRASEAYAEAMQNTAAAITPTGQPTLPLHEPEHYVTVIDDSVVRIIQ